MLKLDDEDSILSSNFDPNVPTAVLMHGWQSQPGYGLGPLLTKGMLAHSIPCLLAFSYEKMNFLHHCKLKL